MTIHALLRSLRSHRYIGPVILLTLLFLPGCAILERHFGEECNTRAYVRTDLESFVSSRFGSGSTARLGIIPFTVPANVSARDLELPGLGNELAWAVQREALSSQAFPIVEIMNRQDWPGKKEEFFTGNFGALQFARDAGYDLILVGFLELQSRIDTFVVHSKVIEVASGITLWYGTTRTTTIRPDMLEVSSTFGLTDRRPDQLSIRPLTEKAGKCIVYDMLNDPEE